MVTEREQPHKKKISIEERIWSTVSKIPTKKSAAGLGLTPYLNLVGCIRHQLSFFDVLRGMVLFHALFSYLFILLIFVGYAYLEKPVEMSFVSVSSYSNPPTEIKKTVVDGTETEEVVLSGSIISKTKRKIQAILEIASMHGITSCFAFF